MVKSVRRLYCQLFVSGARGSGDRLCKSQEGRTTGDMLMESLAQGSVTEGHQI